MIRIKAPRVYGFPDGGPRRSYSEAMHRRVLALVRACDDYAAFKHGREQIWHALDALRAQSEREARGAEKEAK